MFIEICWLWVYTPHTGLSLAPVVKLKRWLFFWNRKLRIAGYTTKGPRYPTPPFFFVCFIHFQGWGKIKSAWRLLRIMLLIWGSWALRSPRIGFGAVHGASGVMCTLLSVCEHMQFSGYGFHPPSDFPKWGVTQTGFKNQCLSLEDKGVRYSQVDIITIQTYVDFSTS